MTGTYLVIEGLEGAGKSTVIHFIQAYLTAKGIEHVCVREPGGTPLAEAIRALFIQSWDESISPETELMLMYAARTQLVRQVIQPHLEKGLVVIGDRHDLSTLAYQGGGRQIPLEHIEPLRRLSLQGFTPDLTLYLDIDPEIGLQRARKRGELDRIEQQEIAFFQRTRTMYQQLAQQDPSIVTIQAEQSQEQVQVQIEAVLDKLWPTA